MRALRTLTLHPDFAPLGFAGLARDVDRWFQDAQAASHPAPSRPRADRTPHVRFDLWRTETEVIVAAEAPGVSKDDFEITVTGEVLTLAGEKKAPEGVAELGHFERAFGKFEREIALPVAVDPSQVRAEYAQGVLTLHLPIADSVRPRRIELE